MAEVDLDAVRAEIRAAGYQLTEDGLRKLQQQMKAAGVNVDVDGQFGSNTAKAFRSFQMSRASANAAEVAKAGAAAETAKAKAEATRAAAELKRLEAAERKRNQDAAERQREFERKQKAAAETEARETREALLKAGINATALGAGLYGGLKYATKIDARRETAVKAAAPHLDKLAKEASTAVKGYEKSTTTRATRNAVKKLAGVVKAADDAKITAKAPRGLGPAAVLLAEGAISRFLIAPNVKNEAAKEAFQALGTASAVAATTIVGKGAINVATPTTPVNAKNLAVVENARAIVKAEGAALNDPASKAAEAKKPARGKVIPATAGVRSTAARFLGVVAKVAVPLSAGMVIASSIASEVEAATADVDPTESPADRFARESKERGQRTFEMADTLTMGALSAISTIVSKAIELQRSNTPMETTAAAEPFVVGGVPTGAATGRAYLNAAAEEKAIAGHVARPVSGISASSGGDGKVAYTTIDGRTVSVTQDQARAYRSRRK